jgi:GGDEF domain-containing protein
MGSAAIKKPQYSDLPPGASLITDQGQASPSSGYSDIPDGATVLHDPAQQAASHHQVDYSAGFTGFPQSVVPPPRSSIYDNAGATSMGAPEPGITAAIDRFRGRLRGFLGADKKPAADIIGGPVLGPVTVAHGLSTIPEHPLRGANETVRGVGQTVALPLAVTNPAFLATAAPYSAGSALFQEGAKYAGIDPDLAEFMSNAAMLPGGAKSLFGKPEVKVQPRQPLQLPAGPRITPPPADASGYVPFTPPPVAATTRAQRLGLILPEKASAPIELGPGEILPPEQSPEGLFPAASRFLVDPKTGQPRVQFLTSSAETTATPAPAPATKGDYTLPNATYLRSDMRSQSQRPPMAPKPDLLQGIREHEFLSKVQDELNLPPGDETNQSFLDNWMAAHNRQAPGAPKGPGLINRAAMADIEQANARGQAVLPPEEPQASPGLINKVRNSPGGSSAPAAASPAARPGPASQVMARQPEVPTEQNTEELLQASIDQAQAKKRAIGQPPSRTVQVGQQGPEESFLRANGNTFMPGADDMFQARRELGKGASSEDVVRRAREITLGRVREKERGGSTGEPQILPPDDSADWNFDPTEPSRNIPETIEGVTPKGELPPPGKQGTSSPPAAIAQAKAKRGPGLIQNAAAAERRQDVATRQKVADMSPEERATALLTSEKTGIPNRRAFDEAGPAKAVAMSDADGLKALNDKFGYDAGDALLKAKADALKEAGLDAYHDKGDEFLYRGESPESLTTKLEKARDIFKNKIIQVETADGQVLQFKGADFSYGTGENLGTAESGLKSNKAAREASGQRARGELRGITRLGPEDGKTNNGGTKPAGGSPGKKSD